MPGAMGNPPSGGPGGPGGHGGPGSSSADISYTAAVEIDAADSQDGQTYASSSADENDSEGSVKEVSSLRNPLTLAGHIRANALGGRGSRLDNVALGLDDVILKDRLGRD